MPNYDDIKNCIGVFMGECLSPVALAETYAAIIHEAKKQLEICMDGLTMKGAEHE